MKESIRLQIEKLNANPSVSKIKDWWLQLTPNQKTLAVGIAVAIGCAPLFWLYFKQATVVKVTGSAVSASGQSAVIGLTKVPMALASKIGYTVLWAGAVGVTAAVLTSDHFDEAVPFEELESNPELV